MKQFVMWRRPFAEGSDGHHTTHTILEETFKHFLYDRRRRVVSWVHPWRASRRPGGVHNDIRSLIQTVVVRCS